MRAAILLGLGVLVWGCQGAPERVASREEQAAEIARLEEQVKSYDLLDSIVADPKAPVDPEKVAERQRIKEQLDRLKAQSRGGG